MADSEALTNIHFMLITLYGVNNIGKSTQAKKLVKNLQKLGFKAKYVKYPIYDLKPTGPFINSILRSSNKQKISEEELQMWFTLNRYQYEPKLKKLLEKEYIVVAEDYIGTALAWGSVKGANLKWLEELNKKLLKEDLAILIKGKRSESAIEEKHIHENADDLIQKVQRQMASLAKLKKWKTVTRQPHPEDTAELILEVVKKKLGC